MSGTVRPRGRKNIRIGQVISDKMDKTISVLIYSSVKHSKYKKYVKKTSVFKAHDESNHAKTGDIVKIFETRALSKTKRWKLMDLVRSGSALAGQREEKDSDRKKRHGSASESQALKRAKQPTDSPSRKTSTGEKSESQALKKAKQLTDTLPKKTLAGEKSESQALKRAKQPTDSPSKKTSTGEKSESQALKRAKQPTDSPSRKTSTGESASQTLSDKKSWWRNKWPWRKKSQQTSQPAGPAKNSESESHGREKQRAEAPPAGEAEINKNKSQSPDDDGKKQT